jgi:hypothetical protein
MAAHHPKGVQKVTDGRAAHGFPLRGRTRKHTRISIELSPWHCWLTNPLPDRIEDGRASCAVLQWWRRSAERADAARELLHKICTGCLQL